MCEGAANLNSLNSAPFFSDARKCSVLAIYIFSRSILLSIRLHSRLAPPRKASKLRRQHVVLNRDMALIYPTRSHQFCLLKTWRCISPVLHLHCQSFCSKNYLFYPLAAPPFPQCFPPKKISAIKSWGISKLCPPCVAVSKALAIFPYQRYWSFLCKPWYTKCSISCNRTIHIGK
jgi:hypothetical protein